MDSHSIAEGEISVTEKMVCWRSVMGASGLTVIVETPLGCLSLRLMVLIV